MDQQKFPGAIIRDVQVVIEHHQNALTSAVGAQLQQAAEQVEEEEEDKEVEEEQGDERGKRQGG